MTRVRRWQRAALSIAVIVQFATSCSGAGMDADVDRDSGRDDVPTTVNSRRSERTLTLAFTGDILVHSPLWKQARRTAGGNGYDFGPMFAAIAPLITEADLAICHLEVPIAPEGTEPSSFPKYGAPKQIVAAIASAGYDRCSTASNHSMDKGVSGVEATIASFAEQGIDQVGMRAVPEDATPTVLDVAGVKLAHLSYTWPDLGITLPRGEPWRVGILSSARVIADARAARAAGAEVVVASFHWGLESSSAPVGHQRKVAEAVTASGEVDLIVGHHAHVIQPIEQINGVWTVFGVGNLLSNMPPPTGYYPPESQDGIVATVGITVAVDGTVTVARPVAHPTWVDKSNGFVIRDVIRDLSDPGLSRKRRQMLEISLERTTRVVGGFVPASGG